MMARTFPTRRSGFTLVEILVVLTVIGILVGMLAAGVIPAMKRANEFAIQTEMNQIGAAIEQFKVKYGFYPPSFATFDSAEDLVPFLNRIAPNHAELSDSTENAGQTRLEDWWNEVGIEIRKSAYNQDNNAFDINDPTTFEIKRHGGADLVFWLSGLSKNKQFPLTGSGAAVTGWVAFNGPMPLDSAGDPVGVERDVFFDFRDGQLDQPPYQERLASTLGTSDSVRRYLQPKGKDAPYLYLNSSSYTSTRTAPYFVGSDVFNASSFQLISAGMDGEFGEFGDVATVGTFGTDNLTNFSEGRLERIILGTN